MRKLLWVLPLLSLMGADCGSAGTCSLSMGPDAGVTVLSCSDGSSAVVAPEAAGANCPHGGQKLEITGGGKTNATYACNGAPGESAKLTVTDEPAGANCPAGGKRIDSQVGNGAVTTSYVCNGQGVVAVAEAAGANCAAGGVKVSAPGGSTYYVCNGTSGTNGTNGAPGADGQSVTVTTEQPGANCPAGGVKITDGVNTQYVCSGVDGASGANGSNGQGATVSSEPPGANCPAGGVAVTADGATTYVCNGTNGQSVTVTLEAPGANCPAGGVKVSGGGTTQYACNGTGGSGGGVGNALGIHAGPDQVVSVGTTVTLAGNAGPTVIGVQWQQVFGPPVALSNPSKLSPTFKAPAYSGPAEKTMMFELRGSDGNVLASDLVVIRLNKAPFKPFIAVSPSVVLGNDSINCFVAQQDPDPDGEPLTHTFSWKKNGQPFTGAQSYKEASVVSHVDTAAGDTFECVAEVSDGAVVVPSDPQVTQVAVLGGCSGLTPYAINSYGANNPICCGANQHNGGDNACADQGQCSPGYRNGGAGLCEYAPLCSGGFQDGGDGTCVPKGSCAAGYHDGGTGSCVPNGTCVSTYHDGGDGVCVLLNTCSPGYHDGNGSDALVPCVPKGTCSSTYVLQQDGTCAGGCLPGQHDDGTGACTSSELCAAGHHDDGTGTCIPDGASPYCASGYKNDGSGACMDTGTCAAGYKSMGGACVAHPACGAGQHDDGDGTCVSNAASPYCASGYHALGAACVPDIYKVYAGGHHACALTTRLGVACWGRGLEGQLGTGTTTGSNTPRLVKGLQSGVLGLALGESHACALMLDGTVRCWGKNDVGQLGDGTTANRLVPVKVKQLPAGVRLPAQQELTLTAGQEHTCALTTSQGVYCWGGNSLGALGGGASQPSPTPVQVQNLPGNLFLVELVSGAHHNCVRTSGNDVGCWGYDSRGQLGDNFNTSSPSQVVDPVNDSSFNPGRLFSGPAASHTLTSSAGGFTHGWGEDDGGQVGAGGPTSERRVPVRATLLNGLTVNDLSAGEDHSCALVAATPPLVGSALSCWGSNTSGQLGYAPFTNGMPAANSAGALQQVAGLDHGVAGVSAGATFTCAVTDFGARVRCWGTGPEGELGAGSALQEGEPVLVQGL